jgi:hypothetical protein
MARSLIPLGERLAAMVLGEPPGEAFVHLRPGRFEDGTLAYESAIV